jgi:hypothetical protein
MVVGVAIIIIAAAATTTTATTTTTAAAAAATSSDGIGRVDCGSSSTMCVSKIPRCR